MFPRGGRVRNVSSTAGRFGTAIVRIPRAVPNGKKKPLMASIVKEKEAVYSPAFTPNHTPRQVAADRSPKESASRTSNGKTRSMSPPAS